MVKVVEVMKMEMAIGGVDSAKPKQIDLHLCEQHFVRLGIIFVRFVNANVSCLQQAPHVNR